MVDHLVETGVEITIPYDDLFSHYDFVMQDLTKRMKKELLKYAGQQGTEER